MKLETRAVLRFEHFNQQTRGRMILKVVGKTISLPGEHDFFASGEETLPG